MTALAAGELGDVAGELAGELAADELRCERCGEPFARPEGRGRPPKRCQECRTSTASTRTTRTPAEDTAPRRPRGVDQLRNNLHGQISMLGAGVMLLDPFDGTVILKNAKQGADVLANLAATNPHIRKGLERGVEMAGWGPVLLWLTTTTLPILAHHGVIKGVADPAKTPPKKPTHDPDAGVWSPEHVAV